MDDIQKALKDPYEGIKISLIVSSKSYKDFHKLCNTLLLSAATIKDTEMLVKIDSMDRRYEDLLSNSPFQFKIITYPPYYRRYSSHLFLNDLCKISKGEWIWSLYEDCEIVNGDWHSFLMKTSYRNKYKDNIVNMAIPMNNGKKAKQICGANIITREWYVFFETVSPFPNLDRWLSELSRKIKRCIPIDEDNLLTHFPQGHRTLSKQQRKDLFYPVLDKYIKKFQKRYK